MKALRNFFFSFLIAFLAIQAMFSLFGLGIGFFIKLIVTIALLLVAIKLIERFIPTSNAISTLVTAFFILGFVSLARYGENQQSEYQTAGFYIPRTSFNKTRPNISSSSSRCEARIDYDGYEANRKKYEPMVRRKAKEFGFVGTEINLIVKQVIQESYFDPYAIGEACEIGLMQIKPTTAEDISRDSSRLEEPEYNVETGLTYLKRMKKTFGSIELAFCGYNMGEAGLQSKIDSGNFNPNKFVYVKKIKARSF